MVERPEVIKLPIGPFALMWAAISTVFGFIGCYISGAISSAIYNWLAPRIGVPGLSSRYESKSTGLTFFSLFHFLILDERNRKG